MDTTEHYTRVADGFERALRGTGSWTAPSPCPDWDARGVAVHVVDTHRRVLGRLDGSEPPVLAADEDVLPAWEAARADLEHALAAHGDTEIDSFGTPAPFGQLVDTLLCADTLLHTWDLARATGQDDTLDLTAVSKAQAFLTPMSAMIRRPGGFAQEVTVPDDATPQERLLAFAGRDPR